MKLSLILVDILSTAHMAVSNTQPWQSEGGAFCRPVGTTLCSVSLWSTAPFLRQLLWRLELTLWPTLTNFSILGWLGRAPKCHFPAWHNANLLPWRLIKREIISVCLAGGSPDVRSPSRSSSDQRWAVQTAETAISFTNSGAKVVPALFWSLIYISIATRNNILVKYWSEIYIFMTSVESPEPPLIIGSLFNPLSLWDNRVLEFFCLSLEY